MIFLNTFEFGKVVLRPVLARPHGENIMKKAAIKFGRRDMIRSVGATMALGALCPQRLWGASSKYQLTDIRVPMAPDNPAVLFDAAKCVQCGQCKTVCERMMSPPFARSMSAM